MSLQPFYGLGCLLIFLIPYTVGRTPCTADQTVARPLPTYSRTQTHKGIQGWSEVRTHDHSVWASEDSSLLGPRGHCDRLLYTLYMFNSLYLQSSHTGFVLTPGGQNEVEIYSIASYYSFMMSLSYILLGIRIISTVYMPFSTFDEQTASADVKLTVLYLSYKNFCQDFSFHISDSSKNS
jgi:hypothetical protein